MPLRDLTAFVFETKSPDSISATDPPAAIPISRSKMTLPTFITTPGLSHIAGSPIRTTCARRTMPPTRAPRRASITMEEATKKKKKKAKPVFALDLKGNFVWNLRSATTDDVTAISSLIPNLPTSIVQSLVEDSPCNVVCEASVKGTKEGEGYYSRVLGAALVDVSIFLKDDSVTKAADFITVAADPELPDSQDVTKKLVLGCLKKCKESGVVEVTSDVAADRADRIELLEKCLFGSKKKDGSGIRLTCKLTTENPDPEKKMT